MNWERFKSLLLTVLVALSLVLTWNLWTYQPKFQAPENTGRYVDIAISTGGKRPISTIVHPEKAVMHRQEEHYGIGSGSILSSMFQAVIQSQFKNVRSFGSDIAKQKMDVKKRRNGIALIFPTAIPVSLFGNMLQSNPEQKTGAHQLSLVDPSIVFDRVVFYKAEGDRVTNMVARFKDGETIVAEASVNNLSFADLEKFYKENGQPYDDIELGGGTVYLPENPVKIKKFYRYYEWIDVDKFKKALFSKPDIVEEQGNYFTAGTQLLKQIHHTIKYINAEPGSEQGNRLTVGEKSAIIQESYTYVNGHSGWTDLYVLFNYTRPRMAADRIVAQRSVTFRLMVGEEEARYPVFSQVSGQYPYRDPGTILVTWKNGDVYEYARTQMDIQRIQEGETVSLPPGKQILTELKNHPNIQMKSVAGLRVGYHMDYPPKHSEIVVFTPEWFVKYNGGWTPVDKLITLKETRQEENSQ